MKDMKLREKVGGKDKTNTLAVQVTMEQGIAPQDNNHTLLRGQVIVKIIHHLRPILPNNIPSKVHPQ